MASIRQEKVANLIKKELAVIFQQNSSSLFKSTFITVTVVRISPDLRSARVYLSFFANSGVDKNELLDIVKNKTSMIRGILGNQVGKQLRNVPELYFYHDDSIDYAQEIDELLK